MKTRTILTACAAAILLGGAAALAQYSISWYTIDGGGQMYSTGGGYELGGTIGQPDAGPAAGPLTNPPYSLVGGFWPAAVCGCLSDLNFDGRRNGADVEGFVTCYLLGVGNCGCADMDQNGVLNSTDVALFVNGLVTATPACP